MVRYATQQTLTEMLDQYISSEELLAWTRAFKKGKAVSEDLIRNKFLKLSGNNMQCAILHLFNQCLNCLPLGIIRCDASAQKRQQLLTWENCLQVFSSRDLSNYLLRHTLTPPEHSDIYTFLVKKMVHLFVDKGLKAFGYVLCTGYNFINCRLPFRKMALMIYEDVNVRSVI